MNAALLLAILAAILAPIAGYLAASRRLSGRIATSEASDLWAESQKMRDDYREQLDAANRRVVALEARMATMERDNNTLVRENVELRERVSADTFEIVRLNEQLAACQGTVAELRATLATMRANT